MDNEGVLDSKDLEKLASFIVAKKRVLAQSVYEVDNVSFPRGSEYVHYIVSIKTDDETIDDMPWK